MLGIKDPALLKAINLYRGCSWPNSESKLTLSGAIASCQRVGKVTQVIIKWSLRVFFPQPGFRNVSQILASREPLQSFLELKFRSSFITSWSEVFLDPTSTPLERKRQEEGVRSWKRDRAACRQACTAPSVLQSSQAERPSVTHWELIQSEPAERRWGRQWGRGIGTVLNAHWAAAFLLFFFFSKEVSNFKGCKESLSHHAAARILPDSRDVLQLCRLWPLHTLCVSVGSGFSCWQKWSRDGKEEAEGDEGEWKIRDSKKWIAAMMGVK